MSEAVVFTVVGEAEFLWAESREISAAQRPPTAIGVLSVVVFCPSCGEVWTAQRGAGTGNFPGVMGNALPVECPGCQVSGTITVSPP